MYSPTESQTELKKYLTTMENYWFLTLISLAAAALLKSLLLTLSSPGKPRRLPPGPSAFPVIGNLIWLRRSLSELEHVLRTLRPKFGPTLALRLGPRLAIFIADRHLAHQALIHDGAVFADRPPAPPLARITSSNQHNISSSFYGPTWRLLRRNLTSEILHPSRVKSYSHAREWVLNVLRTRLGGSGPGEPVRVMDHFQYAMFCLLVFMCFGDKLDEKQISEIERVQRQMLLNAGRFGVLNFFPRFAKIFFRKRWSDFLRFRREQEDVLIPLIRARGNLKRERSSKIKEDNRDDYVMAYADTLFDLELPGEGEKRKLTEAEMMTLCSEFLIGGTDTTATALQWIMANLVKHPEIQSKVLDEMKSLIGDREKTGEGEIREEDLGKLGYLKAVVLEGLRRHPPGHFVLPHAVTEEEVELGGYVVPKKASVNFMVAEMGWDPKVWEDPMSFKPERFVGASFDITGSKEIKMMPFGAGRRMCPGFGLALLHLEYFVANLVWSFEWKAVEGDDVDLSEKTEFTVVMKNPLRAHVFPRFGVRPN